VPKADAGAALSQQATQLGRLGVTVTECVSTGVYLSPANAGYLAARASRAARATDLPVVC
jgi:GTP cyclohydrolase II